MRLSNLFWIGLVISTSIIVFVFGLLYLQDISLNKPSLRFTVMFDNVQGLNDGDNVSMLGKRIGKVSAAKIMGNRVAVQLAGRYGRVALADKDPQRGADIFGPFG